MNSDYNHNPLTEVALALSMAFFALMVLSIFALTQKEQEKSSIKSLVINNSSQVKKENKIKSKFIFYFDNVFYEYIDVINNPTPDNNLNHKRDARGVADQMQKSIFIHQFIFNPVSMTRDLIIQNYTFFQFYSNLNLK